MPTASNSRIRIARGLQSHLQGQDFPAGTLFYEKDTALLKIGNGSSVSAGSDNEHGDPLYTRGIASNQPGKLDTSRNRLHYSANGALSGVFSSLSLKDTQSKAFDLTASSSGSGWNASFALGGDSASVKLSTDGTARVEISGSAITLYPNGYGLTIANAGNSGSSTTQSNSINLQHNSSYYDCIVPANKSGHQFFKLPAHSKSIGSISSAATIATDVSLAQNSIFGQIVLNQNGSSKATTVTGLPNNASGQGYVLKTTTASYAGWVTPPQLTSSSAGAAGSIVVNANNGVSGLQYSTNVRVVGGSSIRVSDSIQFGTDDNYASLTKAGTSKGVTFELPNTTAEYGGTTLLAGTGFTNGGKGKVSTTSNTGITIIDANVLSANNNFVKVSVSGSVISLKQEASIALGTSGTGGVTGTLGVGNGGTGSSTLPSNAILLGNGTGAVKSIGTTVSSSGTAYNSSMYLLAATASGGSISSYSWRTLTYSDIGGQGAISASNTTGTYYILGRSSSSVGPIGSQLYFNTGCFISGSRITAGSYLAQSDINLKENIQDFVETKSILDVPIHRYTWKESKEQDIGFIAQELERVFPELVLGEEGHKTIKESKFVYYLMDEVKRQKARIDVLEKLIKQE